ncbi:MAG: putative two-component system response regulator, partial [uncultured Solirubrobacteraceae bacterium]
ARPRSQRPRPRRGGRRGDRPGPPALPAPGGLRGQARTRRGGCPADRRHLRARSGDPRPRAAEDRRHGGRAAAAGGRRRADPHAHGPRRPRVARGGPGLGRRRLPRQAVRAPGAAGPDARPAAPPAAARLGVRRRRGPVAQPRHARGPPRRARRRAHPARVRAAGVPHAQRAHRRPPPAPPRGGLGLRPVRHHEHHRGLRVEPAAQARGGRGAAPAPHDPRRGVRPACL